MLRKRNCHSKAGGFSFYNFIIFLSCPEMQCLVQIKKSYNTLSKLAHDNYSYDFSSISPEEF